MKPCFVQRSLGAGCWIRMRLRRIKPVSVSKAAFEVSGRPRHPVSIEFDESHLCTGLELAVVLNSCSVLINGYFPG